MKNRTMMAAICLAAGLYCGKANAQLNIPVNSLSGFSHPESVCQSGSTLFVSNIGEQMNPLKKDGGGFISKVDLQTGQIEDLRFLPSKENAGVLNAPKGMALIGNILYVADVDHIRGFDIGSRKLVFDLPVTETSFLNDLVLVKGMLYASATDNGRIYSIDPERRTYYALPLKDTINGANGLYYDQVSDILYCVSIGDWSRFDGKVYAIDLRKETMESISSYQGLLDGVELIGGILYFSDWKGVDKKGYLVALDLRSHQTREVSLPGGNIGGPADFSISADKQYFIIPATLEGRVLFNKIK